MADHAERFDSIESAHEYLGVLAEVLAENQGAVRQDLAAQTAAARHADALQLVDYKLTRLGDHLAASRRLLNDLRTLRRLLYGERAQSEAPDADTQSEPEPVLVAVR
jgi:hypothetical protein